MSSLEFEDQNNLRLRNELAYYNSLASKPFLVRYNIVKTEKAAQAILILLTLVFVSFTLFFFWKIKKNNEVGSTHYNLPQDILKNLPQDVQEKVLLQ